MERFKCPGCAADVQFDPASGALKCSYCGTVQKVSHPVNSAVRELPFEEFARNEDPSRLGAMSQTAVEVACSSCGSRLECNPDELTATCPFCAAGIVTQPKVPDPLIAPNALLPFKVSKDQAVVSVRSWLSSRWFAPDALKKVARPEGVHGVYLPFWTFDARCESEYEGERGDYYYETRTVTRMVNGRQVHQQEQVRRTAWTAVRGRVHNVFDDVLVAATRSINRKRLNDLDPWDLETVVPYEPAYLAGFKAQRYQLDLQAGFDEARQLMSPEIHYAACQDIGGDEQRVHDIRTRYDGVAFKHVLLPVWIGAYRFRGEVFQVIINARTGEVQGERPYSAAKIALLVAAILLALLLAALTADS